MLWVESPYSSAIRHTSCASGTVIGDPDVRPDLCPQGVHSPDWADTLTGAGRCAGDSDAEDKPRSKFHFG